MSLSSRKVILPPISEGHSARTFNTPRNNIQTDRVKFYEKIYCEIENVEKMILMYGDLLMQRQQSNIREVEHFYQSLEDQLNITEIKDPNHLLNILEKNSRQTHILKPEFYDLQLIGNKLKLIIIMLREIPPKMNDILRNYLIPDCVSLIEEVRSKEMPPITKEYNDIITNNIAKIQEKVYIIKANPVFKIRRLSVREYIKQHDDINSNMLEWSNVYLEICCIFRSWTDVDRLYPDKLQETISWLRNKRRELLNRIQKIKAHQVKLETKRIDLEKSIDKILNQITQANFNVNHFSQQDKNVNAAKSKVEYDIQEMKAIKGKHMEEKCHCTDLKLIEFHEEQIKFYNSSILEAKRRLKRLDSISSEFIDQQQNNMTLSNQINSNLSIDKENLIKTESEIIKCEEDLIDITKKVKAVEEQITVVQNIKSMKIGKDNLQQFSHQKSSKSFNDETDDFFKLAAPVIGDLWKEVYKKLSFHPPRDWKQLEMDIEKLDIGNRRLEPSFETLAYLSLQKWRRLSDQSTISDLIKVMKKFNLAKFVVPELTKNVSKHR